MTKSNHQLAGIRAAKKLKERFGEDYYKEIGRKGGKVICPKGFGSDRIDINGMSGAERASIYGQIGGKNRWNKSKSIK